MNTNGNGLGFGGILDNKEFFQAAAGVALIVAGASMLLSNPQTREYLKDGLRAAFPNLDIEKLEDPISMGLSTVMPDLEKYLRLRSM